ncbi:MAG: hypothetical protein NZM04_07560 [Methylacidiphilales bacterium]|nr:hypothetical protein [Candidatus Methylacidiphilales bacterium]MDW8349620.1 hypothetical protein [Verrucomicrobiae bacterium]
MNCLEYYQTLLAELNRYYQAIRSQNPTGIASSLHSLATLETQAPSETHPQLRHYLERKSYKKALDWLESYYSGLKHSPFTA